VAQKDWDAGLSLGKSDHCQLAGFRSHCGKGALTGGARGFDFGLSGLWRLGGTGVKGGYCVGKRVFCFQKGAKAGGCSWGQKKRGKKNGTVAKKMLKEITPESFPAGFRKDLKRFPRGVSSVQEDLGSGWVIKESRTVFNEMVFLEGTGGTKGIGHKEMLWGMGRGRQTKK